jgi:hypothetical protein
MHGITIKRYIKILDSVVTKKKEYHPLIKENMLFTKKPVVLMNVIVLHHLIFTPMGYGKITITMMYK